MYDYKFREIKPSHKKRDRNSLWRVALVFMLALLIGLAFTYLPAWLDWPFHTGKPATDPNIVPLVLPPRR